VSVATIKRPGNPLADPRAERGHPLEQMLLQHSPLGQPGDLNGLYIIALPGARFNVTEGVHAAELEPHMVMSQMSTAIGRFT
jgi:hypothetical protein